MAVAAAVRALGAVVVAAWVMAAAHASETTGVDFKGQRASAETRGLARWVIDSRDAQGLPFAVVDKKDARIFVFDAEGRLLGAASALLGMARGDDSAPGVGDRVTTGIPVEQRTTPAGRFASEPGHNHKGEAIVWVDYDAAVAIHRLRAAPPAERRPQRLASDDADDKRISLGCIVVSPDFYNDVVAPTLGQRRGVVYVLPETRNWAAPFVREATASL